MIYDEFGNMPTIDAMQSKMTVALSRGIVYHLYVQGFDQLMIDTMNRLQELFGVTVTLLILSQVQI